MFSVMKKSISLIRLYCFDTLLLFIFKHCSSAVKPNKAIAKTPLLIVRLDALGDTVLWLDAFNSLIERYPAEEYEYILICNEYCSELFTNHRLLSRIIPVNRSKFVHHLSYRIKIFKSIFAFESAILLNPMYSREFLYSDAVVRFSRAAVKIGFCGDLNNISSMERKISNKWYTHLIESRIETMMELDRNAEFNHFIGLPSFTSGIPEWPLPITRHKLLQNPYYIIFPGSSRDIKKWPTSSFAEITNLIYQKTGMTGLICGGDEEKHLAGQIMKRSTSPLIDKMGQTSLEQVADLISSCSFLVTNDSSAVHIAVSLNIPSICIVGGFHPARFLPYPDKFINSRLPIVVQKKWECFGCNWSCIYPTASDAPAACIKEITVKEVWDQIKSII
ncbi:glycosyltransferase family 9 protein [Paenibacillus sp. P32E]|uniref:glycosyltransferase family 9 protein n=1 Tax=Paenibacillus sp. P32E TaxID=1349434 RepID=UPI00093BAAB2|nr:glycosyltransferase family 9 protein [Paenibacillus sp. P32E]OKP89119.1 hypothetical protein A3848_16585 [Paenibacillus sp. P32E]